MFDVFPGIRAVGLAMGFERPCIGRAEKRERLDAKLELIFWACENLLFERAALTTKHEYK